VRRGAGGKGVNVSRVLGTLGVGSTAAIALGGPDAGVYLNLLGEPGFEVAALDSPGPTRTNVVIGRPGRPPLKINQPGPRWSRRDWEAVAGQLEAMMIGRAWVAICGSLPGGLPAGAYARLVRGAHRAGARVALDAEGPALAAAIAARPDLLKPNRDELAATFGVPCRTAAKQSMQPEPWPRKPVAWSLSRMAPKRQSPPRPKVFGGRARRASNPKARWARAIPCWPGPSPPCSPAERCPRPCARPSLAVRPRPPRPIPASAHARSSLVWPVKPAGKKREIQSIW
jgi:hypothetical protein